MVTTENIVKKKPKVKSASKRIEANPEAGSCVFLKTKIMNNKRGRDVLESKNKKSETNKSKKSAIPSSGERKLYAADNLKVKSSAMGTKKRGLEVVEECRKEKRLKMAKELAQNGERASSVQVALLPKTLTSAKEEQKFWNWGRTNVGQRHASVEERKKLSEQILEVSRGKISQLLQGFLKKLGVDCIREENIELDIDAFAEETLMELKGIIRSFIGARAAKTTNGVQQSERKMNQKRGANNGHRSISGSTANVNMPLNLATSKCGSCDSIRCQCSLQRDYANSSASGLCSERSLGQAHLDTSRKDYDGKIRSSSQISKSDLDSGEKFKTEASQTRASEAASRTELKRQREQERKAASRTKLKRQQEQGRKAASCTELKKQWEQESKAARLALEPMERTVKIDDNLVSLKDLNGKIHSSSKISKSDLDSDGSARALARECTCSLNEPTSGEDCTPLVDVQLFPKMALRAAKLRSRYAKIILKANTFLAHGDKADLILLQKEKESLKRQQREEKFKTEATQTRASEVASRTELKKQREQERKAARLALEQMERTVEIDDNLVSLKDLNDMLRGSWSDTDPAVVLGPIEGIHVGNVLQRLGLFLKDDSMGDEVILNGDINEGEIIS